MKNKTLRSQFLFRLFIVLLVIAFISGSLQLYFIQGQISENVESKSAVLSQSIEQGIEETNLASEAIEHQIDLRLKSYAKRIADQLEGKPLEDITDKELMMIRDQLGLTGITLFSRKEADIVGVRSTESAEIGFSFKKIGYQQGYDALDRLFVGKQVNIGATFMNQSIFVLPIAQSGSHNEKPIFYKYAYYLEPGTNYIINPYIEANEIYQFTNEVGPESWINRMKETNDFIKEIAVLDPRVFENPDLETKLFPPLKKIIYGEYKYKDSRDKQILIRMIKKESKKAQYIEKYEDDKVYKMFLPTKEGHVVYIALDYGALSGPLYRHSLILITSGIVSLIALFLLTASFFNRIYEQIQRIIRQIKRLEAGDLTAKSDVKDGSELERLSQSSNRMVDRLNKLVKDTQEQAEKTRKLSLLLETEASDSVEKMYQLSTETTIKSREQLYEITTFLEEVEQVLRSNHDNEQVQQILANIEVMKEVANERTAATTNMTITLSDLLQSLYGQSSELSHISHTLLEHMSKFKL